MEKEKNSNALALISGGLDSLLAALIVKNAGINVHGVVCSTGLASENADRIVQIGIDCGLDMEILDVSEGYLDIILHPEFGYGTAVNPCIDCHLHFLRAAKRLMEERNYDFVITGEVLGQRPMSQHLKALNTVEEKSGLAGKLLRPLSARLLEPTIPETEGLIDRNLLLDIQGRTRKRQIELAATLGIQEFLQPAGGCFLTDKNYGKKFRDFVENAEKPVTGKDLLLLKIGRHFRLSKSCKLIVGRNESENTSLTNYTQGNSMLAAVDCPGPTGILTGCPSPEIFELAASIILRYADTDAEKPAEIEIVRNGEKSILRTVPIDNNKIEDLRI